MSAVSVWHALQMCWTDVYLEPPDIIAHDAGKQFMLRIFQSKFDMLHIQTKSIPRLKHRIQCRLLNSTMCYSHVIGMHFK